MNEDQLKKIEQELMTEIDQEQKIETMITNSSDEIASHLLVSKKINAEVNDKAYMFSYRLLQKGDVKIMYILIADIVKYKIAGKQYVPFSATAEMDLQYSEKDNLKVVIEAFIRHITDRVKADVLE